MSRDREPERLTGVKARQGRLGRPVLWVLIGSLVLLAFYVIGLMTWMRTDLQERSEPAERPTVGGAATPAPR
jgi:hypothetical protein